MPCQADVMRVAAHPPFPMHPPLRSKELCAGLLVGSCGRWRYAALTWLVVTALTVCLRGASVFSPTMTPNSHVDIRLESWLEALPSHGFVPLTVRIQNGTSQEQTWKITSSNGYGMGGGGLNSTVSMTVEAGRSGERVIYAPVTAQTSSGYYYGTLNLSVSGYGVSPGVAGSINHPGSYGGGRTGYIGMGRAVAANHWSALRNKLTTSGAARPGTTRSELDGSEVDMAAAPEDWRGYSALAQLWMDESEWLAMRPAAKAAMLDWVAMGGRVYVLTAENSEARAQQLGLPPQVGDIRRHGIGGIVLMGATKGSVSLDTMVNEIHRSDTSGLRTQLEGYDNPWGLRKLAGELSLKSGLIFGFIAIFGILVGPVNLFWLAPAGKRQRMFWTTPLLSLGGSLLLLAIMVLQDGIGGSGARLTLGILQPEQKRLAIMQEQVSRTGVLVGRSFPIGEPGWMQPLELSHAGSINPLRENRYLYTETDTMRKGDWFSSRSVQGHLLE